MENSSQITSLLALIAYLVAALLLLIAQHQRDLAPRYSIVSAIFCAFTFVALLLHITSIYTLIVVDQGLAIGFFPAVSMASLLVVATLIAISIKQPLEILSVVLFPIAGLCAIAGAWNDNSPVVTDRQLQWHVVTSVMAYSMLALAATQSLTLALQTHLLRTLQPAGVLRTLPPIDLMEKLLFQMVGAGFVLLSISLLTGILFLEDIFAQHLIHKTTLSIFSLGNVRHLASWARTARLARQNRAHLDVEWRRIPYYWVFRQ